MKIHNLVVGGPILKDVESSLVHNMICHHLGADNGKQIDYSVLTAKTACLFLILLFQKHNLQWWMKK